MSAKIVAITKPLIDGIETAEEFISYAARVSNPSNQMNTLTASKLIKYCIDYKHWSVFETVSLTMEINTTRDIGRQILRHRSFSFQEFSQRYADPTQMGFTIREARLQDKKNRQNSIETNDAVIMHNWESRQNLILEQAKIQYDWAIKNGIAKEQARAVLPEGLTNSRMYMSGTLRSWIHYVQLRTDVATQKEHREIAIEAKNELLSYFPILKETLS
jgi:thymidylate synthase (FAD)